MPLRHRLGIHQVETAYERGWSALKNGDLLSAAEAAEFSVFVTTDGKLKYQQNLQQRRLAIVVLSTTSWPRIRAASEQILEAIEAIALGGYTEVRVP